MLWMRSLLVRGMVAWMGLGPVSAQTTPGVVSAKAYIQRYVNRTVTGTVHVTDRAGATTSAAF